MVDKDVYLTSILLIIDHIHHSPLFSAMSFRKKQYRLIYYKCFWEKHSSLIIKQSNNNTDFGHTFKRISKSCVCFYNFVMHFLSMIIKLGAYNYFMSQAYNDCIYIDKNGKYGHSCAFFAQLTSQN